jgi:hypothetical protein
MTEGSAQLSGLISPVCHHFNTWLYFLRVVNSLALTSARPRIDHVGTAYALTLQVAIGQSYSRSVAASAVSSTCQSCAGSRCRRATRSTPRSMPTGFWSLAEVAGEGRRSGHAVLTRTIELVDSLDRPRLPEEAEVATADHRQLEPQVPIELLAERLPDLLVAADAVIGSGTLARTSLASTSSCSPASPAWHRRAGRQDRPLQDLAPVHQIRNHPRRPGPERPATSWSVRPRLRAGVQSHVTTSAACTRPSMPSPAAPDLRTRTARLKATFSS